MSDSLGSTIWGSTHSQVVNWVGIPILKWWMMAMPKLKWVIPMMSPLSISMVLNDNSHFLARRTWMGFSEHVWGRIIQSSLLYKEELSSSPGFVQDHSSVDGWGCQVEPSSVTMFWAGVSPSYEQMRNQHDIPLRLKGSFAASSFVRRYCL